jgi:hypothetical protein
MADATYLHAIGGRLTGSARTRARLLREIGDHLDDAIAANLAAGMPAPEAAERAVASLGSASALVEAWEARCSRLRRRRRRRSAMMITAVTAASVLAAAQHAEGRRAPEPARTCTVELAGADCSHATAAATARSPHASG